LRKPLQYSGRADLQHNMTVTVQVGYGDSKFSRGVPSTAAEGGDLNGIVKSYTILRAALASHETSSARTEAPRQISPPNASRSSGGGILGKSTWTIDS
jgi:hypothetical protein